LENRTAKGPVAVEYDHSRWYFNRLGIGPGDDVVRRVVQLEDGFPYYGFLNIRIGPSWENTEETASKTRQEEPCVGDHVQLWRPNTVRQSVSLYSAEPRKRLINPSTHY
jgi:hypothetical protein